MDVPTSLLRVSACFKMPLISRSPPRWSKFLEVLQVSARLGHGDYEPKLDSKRCFRTRRGLLFTELPRRGLLGNRASGVPSSRKLRIARSYRSMRPGLCEGRRVLRVISAGSLLRGLL